MDIGFVKKYFYIAGIIFMTSCTTPPKAKKVEHVHEIHGHKRIDHYHWLKKKDDPEVLSFLKKENSFADRYVNTTKKLQEKIYNETIGRIDETDVSYPVKNGDYYYYSRIDKGQQYHVFARKKGNLESKEEVILNQNLLAKGSKYFSLSSYEISPNHKLMAYGIDKDGSEFYDIFVKDLETGKVFEEVIRKTSGDIIWANDNKTLFYTRVDKTHRPYQVYKHTLGSDPTNDEMIFQEDDLSFFVDLDNSSDKSFIFINAGSFTTSEVRFIDSNNVSKKPVLIQKRIQDLEYTVDHKNGEFYILHNHKAINFMISKAKVSSPKLKNWKTFIKHDPKVLIYSFLLQKNRIVVYERSNTKKSIKYLNDGQKKYNFIKFDQEVYNISLGWNPEYDTNYLRIIFESPTTPSVTFDYNFKEKKLVERKRKSAGKDFDPNKYLVERIFVKSKDKKEIPVTLISLKNPKTKGPRPTLVYGYGSYGSTMDPYFSPSIFSLVDRNFIYAIAHVRGSQAWGRPWYNEGKLKNKVNTFNDFIQVTEYLINNKISDPDKIALRGGSAGGLLVGAVLNMRPDLYKAAIASVPFVDILTTILDPDLRFSVLEYEQWGNPHIKEFYDYIAQYSPYDNISNQSYPNILATAGINDSRVNYWEPAKWISKLRDHNTSNSILLLKTELEAGHFGPSGRYSVYKEVAYEYGFLIKAMGLAN